ncbi:esterase/lipase family protein [Streptomyces sp. NPDC058682]|uniref:esterase/lipase family protein n=1 Tax=Streptomyces sp. NPDC058682 TaxID=3346596 RepID=UPI00364AFFEA
MGSVLEDAATGRPLWGVDLATLTGALSGEARFAALRADAQEQAADAETARRSPLTRVRATGLLAKPWWLPVLQGLDPYTETVRALHGVALAPEAVAPFPYDWRLAVAYNGALLARAARTHLTRWRERVAARPEWAAAGARQPRLHFVAHSMGGLVVRAALEQDPELAADTRAVVTVGTPFLGSVKSVLALNLLHAQAKPGRLVRRVQAMAATLPGVHDLLPGYRCLDRGLDIERLTPGDVARLGGDRDLASRSLAEHARHRANGFVLPGHRAVVGEAQPTMQTLDEQRGRAGLAVVAGRQHAFDVEAAGELVRDPATGIPARRDASGDGTVHLPSARTGTEAVTYVYGQHGTLMRHDEVLRQIRRIALERPQGPHLGDGTGDGPGLETPHLGGTFGEPLILTATGLDSPAGATLSVRSATTGRPGHPLTLHRAPNRTDGALSASFTPDAPDLYRVTLDTGRHTPVTQLVLVTPPDA